MEFPSNVRASIARSLTLSGVNLPDLTPSMRSISGLVTSSEQTVMCSRSFSMVFASSFFINLDSEDVKISSNFGQVRLWDWVFPLDFSSSRITQSGCNGVV